MCVVYAHVCAEAYGGQKRARDLLETEVIGESFSVGAGNSALVFRERESAIVSLATEPSL